MREAEEKGKGANINKLTHLFLAALFFAAFAAFLFSSASLIASSLALKKATALFVALVTARSAWMMKSSIRLSSWIMTLPGGPRVTASDRALCALPATQSRRRWA
jgi:hypothetical protein